MPAPLTPDSVLQGLTPPQREAAMTIDGPLLVLAGAGSGKTRTITRRIAYMVACGIPAWNILAITFTNKAAGEMRTRVASLLSGAGNMGRGATVATFHSLCARLLREFAADANLPNTFSIFDSADQTKLIKQAIKDCSLSVDNFQPGAVQSAISNAKNKLQTPEAFAVNAAAFFERNVARIYAKYEALLRENKAVDFDDLLLKMAILLRDNATVRQTLEERFQYVLIDEYQDTNHAQFVIAHMLCRNHKNICATGDPDQSIYGWRGANLSNILEFEQFYPNAKVVLLEQNYRSTKVILQAASALIARNTKRKKKDLWTDNQKGEKIVLLKAADEHQEAAEVVKRMKAAKEKEGLSWSNCAIFYRTNSLSRVLEDALMKAAIPYQIARGTEFYARKEIKDMLAYLRVVANPADSVNFERIVNVPPRGLGDTSLTRVQSFGAEFDLSLLEACGQSHQIPGLAPRAAASCKKVAELFKAWRAAAYPNEPAVPAAEASEAPLSEEEEESLADLFNQSEEAAEELPLNEPPFVTGTQHSSPITHHSDIRGLMDRIYKESGLEADYKKEDDTENAKAANIEELITVAAEFDAQNPTGTLNDYLEQVTLASDVDKLQDAGGSVTLMTLHAAKGLEFPWVAIIGMEDGLIPHSRAISGLSGNNDDMEEERRLAFVGITRAMVRLTLSSARYRMVRGETIRTIESQFISEMPDEIFDLVDLTAENDDAGSVGYHDEGGYGRRAQKERRSYESTAQRSEADALAGEFKRGMLVRHAQFGLGRIEEISAAGTMTRAVVKFQTSGTKKLILQYARLEKVDA